MQTKDEVETDTRPMVTRSAYNRLGRDLDQALEAEKAATKRVSDIRSMIAGVRCEPEPVKAPKPGDNATGG